MGKLDKLPGFDDSNSRRRNVVVGGVYALAGCIGLGAAGGGGETEIDDSGSSDTSQEESGGDNTESNQGGDNEDQEQEQEQNEENSDAEERIHDIGESFTVGDGNRSIGYTVTNIVTAEVLGNDISNEEPDGIFAVVEMEITNQTDDSFNISSNNYSVVTENENTFDPSDDVIIAYESDERFDTESILFEQLNPNLTTEGAVIFDIPPETAFTFRISPASFLSSADPHFVRPS